MKHMMFERKTRYSELVSFFRFFSAYAKARLRGGGIRFEKVKDIIVALLVVKRGKYSSSFLNTSFFLFVGASLIAGPIIVENNPFISGYFEEPTDVATQQVLSADVYSMSFQTQFSHKPRATIEQYQVKPGDTLASIANKFDIDVNTIKWQNNLKNDTIKPGQTLEILPVPGIAHKVRSGESIYSIARRYRVDAQNILNFPFNEFEDLDTFALNVGQVLIVPDGVPPAAPPVVRQGITRANVIAGVAGVGRFIWPTTGYISQAPVSYHMALDIANKGLPPVIAADGGSVIFSGCLGYGYGCHVIIDHGNGFQTLYGHLSRIDVSAGQAVGQGQKVGNVGSTGRSTGPHLHFEIRSGGVLQNPLGYLR
jgi:murein DD-endopeptidase MepM/ murein hydrolase activator NlpD